MKRETFLKRLETKKSWDQNFYIRQNFLKTLKKIEDTYHSGGSVEELRSDALFYFDLGHSQNSYQYIAAIFQDLSVPVRDILLQDVIVYIDAMDWNDGKRQVRANIMEWWGKTDTSNDHFLWDFARRFSEHIMEDNPEENARLHHQQKSIHFQYKVIFNYHNPDVIDILKTFPCKDGMLQGAVKGPDDVFEKFVGLDYSEQEWMASIFSLMGHEMAEEEKDRRIDQMLDATWVKKIFNDQEKTTIDAQDAKLLLIQLEGTGRMKQSDDFKLMFQLTVDDKSFFLDFFRSMRRLSIQPRAEFFDRYGDVALNKSELTQTMCGVMLSNHLHSNKRKLSENDMIFFLENLMGRFDGDNDNGEDKHNALSNACFATLKQFSTTWQNLPKVSIINFFMAYMTNADKQKYLEHCGGDPRVNLMKKVINHVEIDQLLELKETTSWSEKHQNLLKEKISKKEKSLIQSEIVVKGKESKRKNRM